MSMCSFTLLHICTAAQQALSGSEHPAIQQVSDYSDQFDIYHTGHLSLSVVHLECQMCDVV